MGNEQGALDTKAGRGKRIYDFRVFKGVGQNYKQAIFFFIAALIVIFVVWILWHGVSTVFGGGFPRADRDTYQAVFLTNNQVYFGKLKNFSREYVVLRDIYYLRVSSPLQQTSPPGAQQPVPTINLIKIGSELHGPQDRMFIPKDRILFWENMKKDAQVMQAITQRTQSQ